MLIFEVIILTILGADAVFNPVEKTDVAVEKENINSIQDNENLYPETQARTAAVDEESSRRSLNWTCPVNESDDHSGFWYTYLNSLYCELSTYERQVAKESYNVADIENWGVIQQSKTPIYDNESWKNNDGEGIVIDERNFGKFLEKTKAYGIAKQNMITNMEIPITKFQLNELNHILDLTIKDKMEISCSEPYMYITGNNILFSHINHIISVGAVDKTCRDLLDTNRLKYMNIFALNTIFINDDIQKKIHLITVIAPKWEIIGKRTMDLNGKHGEPAGAADLETTRYRHAEDGKSGNPGEPGRNFFGIGKDFVHGENLNISANGGDGSPGENGKNGERGKDGALPGVPTINDYACDRNLCLKGEKLNLHNCKQINCILHDVFFNPFECFFELEDENGSPGGNAGNGGKGGKGGNPGDIVLFELDGRSGITQSNNTGSDGLDGKGGVGGLGGMHGKIKAKCEWNGFRSRWYKAGPISRNRAASGKNGIDGRSEHSPREVIPIPNLHKAKTINKYKTYLRANINDPFRNYFLVNFLNYLENNTDVKSVYDVLGFIDELKSLEKQFHSLYRYVNFLPFYKSLLDRIDEHAQNVSNKNDKKVLAYVYTATSGRTHNLEDDLESSLISDITKYLTIVKDDIEKLKEWQKSEVREEIANKYKQEYKTEIDKKIADANDLISKEIIPEIHNIETGIDIQIENLANEVINLEHQAEKDDKKLKEKRVQLQNELILQGFFGALKILGSVVSFMGPVGTAVGSAINIGTSLAETALLDATNSSDTIATNLKQSATDITSLTEKINAFGTKKATELKERLEIVSEQIKKNPDLLGGMSAKVDNLKSKLNTMEKNKITIKDVQILENELKRTIETQSKGIMEAQKSPNSQNTNKAVAAMGHLQKAVQLASVTVDTYNKYKQSRGKLEVIEKAIKQNEDKFDKLKEYEKNIYNTMVPMLENMESNLDDVINKMRNNNKVVLDLTRWKVQSTLKEMMSYLQNVTQGYKVQGSLQRCMEKLQEAMNALINVQNYIQDYQKDQTLANFLAGVSSISVNDFDISYNLTGKNDLRDALQDLGIITAASVVIQRHRVAIDAVKQFVFPFADMYFKDLMLPSHLELDNENTFELDDVILRATNHIDKIKSKLDDYKASIKSIDQCSASGKFKSKSRSTNPFFVWENANYSDTISRLLSGKEVIVSANINNSRFIDEFDAIKFNDIGFVLNAKNNTIQSEINDILKSFTVTGTHLGNSFYRYQDNIYLITTADVTIWYSFEKDDGKPIHANDAYNKMKHGDFVLSPYASWKIKLGNLTKEYSFKDLEKYKHEVDLTLEGVGHYIRRGEKSCSYLEVNKYYKPINKQDTETARSAFDFVPLFAYDILARQENVTASQECEKAQNNSACSDHHGNKKADSTTWLTWFSLPKF